MIQTDFGTQKNICSIDIAWDKNRSILSEIPYKFVVSVSNDTANYTNVFSGEAKRSFGQASDDEDVGKNDLLMMNYNGMSSQLNSTNSTSPVSARYIRINITEIAGLKYEGIGNVIPSVRDLFIII